MNEDTSGATGGGRERASAPEAGAGSTAKSTAETRARSAARSAAGSPAGPADASGGRSGAGKAGAGKAGAGSTGEDTNRNVKRNAGRKGPASGGRRPARGGGSGGSGARSGRTGGTAAGGGGGTPAPGGYLAQPLRPARIPGYLLLFVLGALTGTAGALVQPAWFPGGLLLALAGAGGLFLGGGRALGRRAGTVAPAAGWLVAVLLLTTARPEGDFVFGAGLGSYAYLLGGLALGVICATLGQPASPGADAARFGT